MPVFSDVRTNDVLDERRGGEMSTMIEQRSRTRDALQQVNMEYAQHTDFAHNHFGIGPFG